MYYGKAIGRAKEYILGPAFLFPRFAGGRQMVCSSVHQQLRLAAVRRESSIPPPIGLRPIGPPPFEGRTKRRPAASRRSAACLTVRPSKGVARRLVLQHLSGRLSPCGWGPCAAWWWDAWAIGRGTNPGNRCWDAWAIRGGTKSSNRRWVVWV